MQRELMYSHIMSKCMELFLQKPADKLKMDEIAVFCSISKPTLYSYFKNKEAIILALFDEIHNRVKSEIKKFVEEAEPENQGWEYFDKLFDLILNLFSSYRNLIVVLIKAIHSEGFRESFEEHCSYWKQKREEIVDFYHRILFPLYRSEIKESFDAKILTVIILNIFSGFVTDLYFSENVNWQKNKLLLKELFQNGIFDKEEQ